MGIADKLLQAHSLFRNFFVQRECPPKDLYPIFSLKPFNTPGTEIAPGSGKIGKYFQKRYHRVHGIHPWTTGGQENENNSVSRVSS
jgi:hypothetical protein